MVTKARPVLCAGQRRDGQPCRAPATIGPHCIGHAPVLAEKRQEARRRGGRNKASVIRLGRLCPPRLVKTFDLLEQVLDELHKETLPPQVGSAMAAVAGQMARILVAGELEARVRLLEAARPQASSDGRRER
jgi:hypothetical protein